MCMKIIRIMILSLLLAVYGLAWGGYKEGLAAMQRGDYDEALREWRPSAEQGNASAQYNLGQLYREGLGVTQDYKEAEKWYRKAAQQGFRDAHYNLGFMYYEGYGVPQNYKEAMRWYLRAAEKGLGAAQYMLGVMYLNGEGVLQDNVQAYMWFSVADANDIEEATRKLDVISTQMTPTQVAKAYRLARGWMQKHPKRTGKSE